ncbi:hypothetical protein BCR43DRAFT_489090 [Syncephalastrum racemosum]|uniref:Uncharacterized protein n=1 Tax=Syncephalastrum racemosum TaxID=13706 RepID=A0A1X2HL61_SYNRA|nr:hypothetical protein BCR43DRAFT_489090 [Syncephalastrum racemosum]
MDSVFVCQPFRINSKKARLIGIYTAGILFALAWWLFIDGVVTLSLLPDRKVAPGFEDWAPGIVTTLGMIIVSLIDKEALRGSTWDDYAPLRARLFLFLGFAMMAGGFAGSVSVLTVKYVMHDYDQMNSYLGVMDVAQCSLLMLSTAVLWLSQQSQQEHLQLF